MITIEIEVDNAGWDDEAVLRGLARAAIDAACEELGIEADSELSLYFTGDETIRSLNADWRGKDKPTNVLSFPAMDIGRGEKPGPLLGDVVLAFETVSREAHESGKPLNDHLTHLIVHGFLHLLGYDHENETDAVQMETLETAILGKLAIADPYAVFD